MPWSGRVMAAGLLALSLGVPAASAAQREIRPPGGEFTCYPDKPGTFQYRGSTDALTFGITAPQARTFLGHLEAMRDIVRAAPVFNPLLGVDAYDVHADFCCPWDCQRDKSCRSRPVHGRLVVFLHYWMSNGPGRTPFTQVEERSEFELHVNRTILLESGAFPVLEDGRRPGYAPQPWREVNGATLVRYHSDYDLYVVLTHGKRPLQIPVTREQYLRAVIRDREKEQRKAELDWDRAAASLPVTQQGQLREVRSKLASVREMMVGQLQRQLDQMSPAERASQAWVRSTSDISPLVPEGTDTARPVVAVNPEYFDRTRPRTDVQLIVARLDGIPPEGVRESPQYCSDISAQRLWELAQQVDWARLAAIVRR